MIGSIVFIVLGFIILIKGANWLVVGAAALAQKHKVSELAIGLTIVAFGTSMPEFVVNSFAAYDGYCDIAFGNIIGSNNFNLYIILGTTGLISPLVVQTSTVWKEIPYSLLAALLLLMLANNCFLPSAPLLSRFDGLVFLVFFGGFLWYVVRQVKHLNLPKRDDAERLSNLHIGLAIIGGLLSLIIGGKLVEMNAVKIAQTLGVSQKVIGLTIVAMGTSLPELATSIVAASRKKDDLAVGNIIGSNIFNIFFILGVCSLIKPLTYNAKFDRDLVVLIIGTLLLIITMFTGKKKRLDRWEAAILLMLYIGYIILMIYGEF
jgi:cation:H+ antiporter